MKLRNKKTGEIIEAYTLGADKSIWDKYGKHFILTTDDWCKDYNSLADLNEEWEDYEEPEMFYWIDYDGKICKAEIGTMDRTKIKEIGNYFETREEAEQAVEKLKAWKRLEDKGFAIEGWDNSIGDDYYKTGDIVINLNNVKNRDWNEYNNIGEIKDDLDLLFGGEE